MAASSSRWVIDLGGDNTESNEITPEESLGAVVARTYVVGKILGDRRPHISQIRSQMSSVWYIKGDFRIIPKPNNVFLIGFELEEDKKKVLKGTPWLVSHMHFCLKGWYPDLILSQICLCYLGWRVWINLGKKFGLGFSMNVLVNYATDEVSMDTPDVPTESDEAQPTGGDPNINAVSPCSNNIITRSVSKKRKAVEEVLMSPINENARRAHTGMMNTIAELVTDLHDASPIHSSASKPSWKRMARTTKVKYQPSTLDLIQAFDMEARGGKVGKRIGHIMILTMG
ncbi:hypothetical protein Tsubulata_042976 [Turnera subulata]|uniref:DUF4283 domain-containing protein n=1 Tax=Turnera subulata TaxID=218843 RepID=A0A9Q0GDH9_9ROSI|nr:hypothetical protein Tsubulata_042976 [Turnera subulata]